MGKYLEIKNINVNRFKDLISANEKLLSRKWSKEIQDKITGRIQAYKKCLKIIKQN